MVDASNDLEGILGCWNSSLLTQLDSSLCELERILQMSESLKPHGQESCVLLRMLLPRLQYRQQRVKPSRAWTRPTFTGQRYLVLSKPSYRSTYMAHSWSISSHEDKSTLTNYLLVSRPKMSCQRVNSRQYISERSVPILPRGQLTFRL